jgi:O-antigen/teichoic acid export membrane protein
MSTNIFHSPFFKSVVVLTTGTMMAQIVSYLSTPIITRLYSPEEIGALGLFFRAAGLIAAVGTLRYEYAIPLPNQAAHGFALYRVALRIMWFTALLSFLFLAIYSILSSSHHENYLLLLLIAVGGVLLTFKNIGTYWAIRLSSYRRISLSNFFGSAFGNGFKIFAGLLSWGKIGILLGAVLGLLVSAIYFIPPYLKAKKDFLQQNSKRRLRAISKIYKDFPLVNLPNLLVDQAREFLLAIFIILVFSEAVFGSYDHSFRMLKLPLVLIGTSIGQVFFNQCAEKKKFSEPIYPLLTKTMFSLAAIGIIPFAVIYFFGAPIFEWVFGEQWRMSGLLSQAIAPWLFINFVASPLSTLPLVIDKQPTFLWLNLFLSIFQVAIISLPFFIPIHSEEGTLLFFQILGWLMAVGTGILLIVKSRLTKAYDSIN